MPAELPGVDPGLLAGQGCGHMEDDGREPRDGEHCHETGSQHDHSESDHGHEAIHADALRTSQNSHLRAEDLLDGSDPSNGCGDNVGHPRTEQRFVGLSAAALWIDLIDPGDRTQELSRVNQGESHDERHHPEDALDVVEREEPPEVGRRDASAEAARNADAVVGRQLAEVRNAPADDGRSQGRNVADRPPFSPEGDLAAEDLELPPLREEVGGNEHRWQANGRDEEDLAVSVLDGAWKCHHFLPEMISGKLVSREDPEG